MQIIISNKSYSLGWRSSLSHFSLLKNRNGKTSCSKFMSLGTVFSENCYFLFVNIIRFLWKLTVSSFFQLDFFLILFSSFNRKKNYFLFVIIQHTSTNASIPQSKIRQPLIPRTDMNEPPPGKTKTLVYGCDATKRIAPIKFERTFIKSRSFWIRRAFGCCSALVTVTKLCFFL